MPAFNSAVAPGSGSAILSAMAQNASPMSQMSPGTPGAQPPMATPPTAMGGSPMGAPGGMPPPMAPQGMPPPQPQQPQAPPKPSLPMTQENVIIQALIKQLERLDTNKKVPGIQLPPGLGQ